MRQQSLRWLAIVCISLLSLLWLCGQVLQAQARQKQAAPAAPAVTVLSPQGAASDVIGEGDDYFTQVQHNPRDMNDKDDLVWQVFGITNISYANGIWTGTTSNTPVANPPNYSSIYMVFPGYSLAGNSVAEIGKTGWNYPINANNYKLLSFRMKAPGTAAGNWWHAAYTNYSFTT